MNFDRDFFFEQGRKLLTDDGLNGVRWPSAKLQLAYTGAEGEVLLKRTIDFIEKLVNAAPVIETEAWRGLDYGVGFGRIASLLSLFGNPSKLTCVDAWEKSLDLARMSGLRNPSYLIEPWIKAGSLPTEEYDFAYAYSIFTHLPEGIFLHNIRALIAALKPDGVLIVTVREPKFIEFLQRSNKFKTREDRLNQDGYWFGNAQSTEYGDTVVSSGWIDQHLKEFGTVTKYGTAASEPFQCILAIRKQSSTQ